MTLSAVRSVARVVPGTHQLVVESGLDESPVVGSSMAIGHHGNQLSTSMQTRFVEVVEGR
jgi:hypothetical protein